MKVTIKDLPPDGKLIEDSVPCETLDFPDELGFQCPIAARIELSQSGRQITVRGQLSTVVQLSCHRCLEPYDLAVQSQFEHYFLPRPEREAYAQMADLDEAELGMSYYDGELIDLGPSIHDAVLLEVPMKQICRADCPGICPRCGGPGDECSCSQPDEDGPPSPFKDFFREQGLL